MFLNIFAERKFIVLWKITVIKCTLTAINYYHQNEILNSIIVEYIVSAKGVWLETKRYELMRGKIYLM